MEAKDTVIKNEDIMDLDIPCETCENKPSWGFPTRECMECMALKHREAQAEISFNAGYKQRDSEFVYNPDYLDFKKGVIEGKKLGIKDVVEWFERCKKIKVPKYQLKEWGL